MATRRYGTIIRHLTEDPDTAPELCAKLSEDTLFHLAAAVTAELQERALSSGDRDAVIAEGFEKGFGRDGLGLLPWVQGLFIVCPGGMIAKNRGNHKCRFVSVNDCWVWDSAELICEEKRSTPGVLDGFRAVALLPVLDGMELDVVKGKMRSGQHSVDSVVSFVVKRGELIEVSQRVVSSAGMQ